LPSNHGCCLILPLFVWHLPPLQIE
jgi:hypothetical protein